jgi:hypothetical protein
VRSPPSLVRFQIAISRASMASEERSEFESCQPTTIREKTSTMKAA